MCLAWFMLYADPAEWRIAIYTASRCCWLSPWSRRTTHRPAVPGSSRCWPCRRSTASDEFQLGKPISLIVFTCWVLCASPVSPVAIRLIGCMSRGRCERRRSFTFGKTAIVTAVTSLSVLGLRDCWKLQSVQGWAPGAKAFYVFNWAFLWDPMMSLRENYTSVLKICSDASA